MTDFSNFFFIFFIVLSIFSYIVFNVYILTFLFVLCIVLFLSYRGYLRGVLIGTVKQDRRNDMSKRKIEKMSSGRRTTIGGHPMSPKPHKIHSTYPISLNTSSRTPLTPLHKSPWSNSSVLNDQVNDASTIIKKRSTWTSGKTNFSFLHNQSNGSPWSNSLNQSYLSNDKSDVASSSLPAFLPMIKRALGLERLPEPSYSSPRRHTVAPIPNTGLSPGVYPNFRTRKQERLSLSEKNTSMYWKTNTVKIAPPDPNRTLSPYLSRLKADASMTEKSTPDTRAVVTALRERRSLVAVSQHLPPGGLDLEVAESNPDVKEIRKRSMNAQEETTPDVPVHHAKRRRQESQHSNASTSSLPSLPEALPDLSQHNYNIPRLETPGLKRPSRPSQEQNEDYESRLSVKRPRQQTRNNAVWSSLSSSRKMAQRREILGKDLAKRKLDLTEPNDKENTENLSKLQRMETVILTPDISFMKEQSKMKQDRDNTESPDSSLNASRGSKGVESEPSRHPMLKNLSSSKKSSLSIYSEMNTRQRKVSYANVLATLEDYDKDKEAEQKRVQQMLQDVDEAFKAKSDADKVKSTDATTVTSTFTTAPVSATTAYMPTLLNSSFGLKSTSQTLATSSEPTASVSLAAVVTTTTVSSVTSIVAPVPLASLALPSGEIPKTPPKEVIPQQESGEGNKTTAVTAPSSTFSGFISSNQTTLNNSQTQARAYSSSVQINLNTPGSQEPTSSITAISSAALPGFIFGAGTTNMAVTSSSQPQFSFKPVFPSSATTATTTTSSGIAGGFNFRPPGGSGATTTNSSGFMFTAGTSAAAPSLNFNTLTSSSNPAPIFSTNVNTGSFHIMQKSTSAPGSGTGFNFATNSSAPSSMPGGLNFTQLTSSAPTSAGFNFNVNKTTASTVGGFTFSTNTTTSSTTPGNVSFVTNTTTSSAKSGFNFLTNTAASNATGGFNFMSNTTASNAGSGFIFSANTSMPSAASVFKSGNSSNSGQTNSGFNFPSSTVSSGTASVFNTGTFSFSSNMQTNTTASTTGAASNMSKFGANSGTTDQKSGVGFNFTANTGKSSFGTGQTGGTTSPFGQSGTVSQQTTNLFGQSGATSQQTSNLFGQNTTANQKITSPFGQSGTTNQPMVSPFGQSTTASQQKPSLFGQSGTANQQTSNMFGQSGMTNQQTSNVFGQSGTANQQNPNMFGQSGTAKQQTPNMFGQSASSNQQTSNPFEQRGNAFGTPVTSSAPFVFGQGGSTPTDSGANKGFNFSASAVTTSQFNFNANSSFGTPGFGSPPSNPFTSGTNVFSVGSTSTAARPRSTLKGKRRTAKK